MAEINRMSMTQLMAFYYAIKREDYLTRADTIENLRVGGNADNNTYSSIVKTLRSVKDD